MNYNYVITGNEMYSPPMFMAIANRDNVRLYTTISEDFKSPLSYALFRLHFSEKINKIISKPFSDFIYRRLYQPDFHNNNRLCIIFMCDKADIYNNTRYIEAIRHKNPGIKLVLYIVDMIDRNAKLDVEYAKKAFDLIVSYDYNDAEKYGLKYYPTPHSKIVPPDTDAIEKSDVYFCGKAKSHDRLAKIIRIFELCKAQGLKCDFIITDVPETEKVYTDEITYNTSLTYIENCQHIIKTKAIAEILQDGASGFTPRLWDSIIHEKYLITDNFSLPKTEFYDPKGMLVLDPYDISGWDIASFAKNLSKPLKYNQETKEKLSPSKFIEFIEKSISQL